MPYVSVVANPAKRKPRKQGKKSASHHTGRKAAKSKSKRKRNPIGAGFKKGLFENLKVAGTEAVGALGTDLALGYLGEKGLDIIPAKYLTGYWRYGIGATVALVAGGVLESAAPGRFRRMVRDGVRGALAVNLYQAGHDFLKEQAPSLPLSGGMGRRIPTYREADRPSFLSRRIPTGGAPAAPGLSMRLPDAAAPTLFTNQRLSGGLGSPRQGYSRGGFSRTSSANQHNY